MAAIVTFVANDIITDNFGGNPVSVESIPSRAATPFRDDLYRGYNVLVTGGTGGLGRSIALAFRTHGADVVVTGSSTRTVEAARDRFDQTGILLREMDVRRPDEIGRVISSVGRLDVVVNAAGISRPGRELEYEVGADVIDVNLIGTLRVCAAVRSQLQASGGCIINIASVLSFLADPHLPAYGGSKTGIVGLTASLAHGFGSDNVRVNAIAPGYHVTEMTKAGWTDPDVYARIAGRAALNRWGTADDLNGAALFLASPSASFITGVTLPVDGGYCTG